MRTIDIDGVISTETGEGGLPFLRVRNKDAEAAIYLYGAHIASFTPVGGTDLLWLSPTSSWERGKPIRGGIPLCFPWFGPHPTRGDAPLHGFARLRDWTPLYGSVLHDGRTRAALELRSDDATRALWPYEFRLELVVTVGKTLEVELVIENTGTEPFACSECLHTYFGVADAAHTRVVGLDGACYAERVGTERLVVQSGDLAPCGETNRAWPQSPNALALHDEAGKRTISIEKEGLAGTVVWNAWEPRALEIADIGAAWRKYLCVESGNVLSSRVVLPPQGNHRSRVRYSLA